ncbi:hypothetical protein AGMMS49975_04760 [Clostridia bacterium]|nr:hypothetical protein AGMMS49975_04760 [Clostridia bacterium]
MPKHRYIVEKIESPTAVYVGCMKYNGLLVDRSLMDKQGTERTHTTVHIDFGVSPYREITLDIYFGIFETC